MKYFIEYTCSFSFTNTSTTDYTKVCVERLNVIYFTGQHKWKALSASILVLHMIMGLYMLYHACISKRFAELSPEKCIPYPK